MGKKPRKASAGRKEILLPIVDKKAGKKSCQESFQAAAEFVVIETNPGFCPT
jgi:hypothetical protein